MLPRCNLNVLPLVRREVVDRGLVGSTALLEPSKDDHLCRLKINYTSVLISEHHLITSRLDN